jgi:ferric-dicitrate binding protein FerR (iron transport regulator)
MADDQRIRRMTLPPPRQPTLDERVASLERADHEQQNRNADMLDELRRVTAKLSQIDIHITELATLKEAADKEAEKAHKRVERWKTAGLSLLVALAVGLFGWIARIAWVVQTAKAFTGQ